MHLSSVPSASIPTQVLDTIPVTIRDMLKCKKPYTYTSIDARKLLVTLADVPQAYNASLLTISNKYAGFPMENMRAASRLIVMKSDTLQYIATRCAVIHSNANVRNIARYIITYGV